MGIISRLLNIKPAPSHPFADVNANPDVAQSELNPLEHYINYRQYQEGYTQHHQLTESLKKDYMELRHIEPLLPSWRQLNLLPKADLPDYCLAGDAYFRLAEMIDRPFSHLFLLSGAGDKDYEEVAINFCKLLLQESGADAPLILILAGNDNTLQNRFPTGIRIIHFDSLVNGLEITDKVTILVRLIIQAAPKVVHDFNSEVGWKTYTGYHRQLAKYTQLAACLLRHDIDGEGMPSGYSIEYFNRCIDNLKWIFTESDCFKQELSSRFALEPFNCEKLIVVDQQATDTIRYLGSYL